VASRQVDATTASRCTRSRPCSARSSGIFRDRSWSVRVPRRLQELHLAISAANSELTHALGRAPTVADIAAHLKITEEQVLEGLESGRAYTATSLSSPVNEASGVELGDIIGAVDTGFELTEDLVSLRPALAKLDERERAILSLRFCGDMSQSEIGEQLGISQMHVSRLLGKAIAALRTPRVAGQRLMAQPTSACVQRCG
jgi:RNA polymerase sigma-B factor